MTILDFKEWQEIYNSQKKNNIPPPQTYRIFGYQCPDCKKQISGRIVNESIDEIDKEYPIRTYILWECDCGYKFPELEEGK